MKYKLSKLFVIKEFIWRTLIFIVLYFLLDFGIRRYNLGFLEWARVLLAILYIILGTISPLIEYFFWSYFIFDDFIEIKCGIFYKRYICIKIDKIKYINICEDPISALLKLKSVSIYTAGGRVVIPALNRENANIFYDIVKRNV
ncbi:PH domain-containing protein [Clostridium sp. B9]|uniref:PH domain-containing protein n=1 Tax=Clostridium sp. B9 TaxID=3423224 RepID=UPI003D2F0227